jgi:Leucine-rich repeat (LRR) protein
MIIPYAATKSEESIMDHTELAKELIDIQALLLQIPAKQQLSKLHTGSLFFLNYLAQSEHAVHPQELSEKLVVSTARIAS